MAFEVANLGFGAALRVRAEVLCLPNLGAGGSCQCCSVLVIRSGDLEYVR